MAPSRTKLGSLAASRTELGIVVVAGNEPATMAAQWLNIRLGQQLRLS